MSASGVHWVKGNDTGRQPSWKTVLWEALQLWNGQSAFDTVERMRPRLNAFLVQSSLNLSERRSKVLFHSYCVCLHSDQLVARAAVSYKLCASTSAYHAALALSWFWCRDGIMGQLLDGCERAVDSGGLLQCSVGGNTHQCPQQPRSSTTVQE